MANWAVGMPIEGVDVNLIHNVFNYPLFPLGFEVIDSSGTTYKYVQWTAAKTLNALCILDSTFTVQGTVDTTSVASTLITQMCCPQVALPVPVSPLTKNWGFVAVKGPLSMLNNGAITIQKELAITVIGNTGQIIQSAGATSIVPGLYAPGTVAGTGTAVLFASLPLCNISWLANV